MNTIMLISSSPRRQELLRQAGFPFFAAPSRITEQFLEGEEPRVASLRLAQEKLEAFLQNSHSQGCNWALAADTFIVLDGNSFGKPLNLEEARNLLHKLSGRVHQVYTGLALKNLDTKQLATAVEITQVEFDALTENDINWYLSSGEWQDVAGGYRIQGKGQCLIKEIQGSYSNVLGLPLQRLFLMLKELGYTLEK